MLLVLPFCSKDGELAIKNLQWIRELDPKLPYHCLLSHDNETPARFVRDMTELAGQVFSKVTVAWYPAPEKKHWPAAANWAFQNASRYVAHFFPNESWLFLEADATPIRSGWFQQLKAEHIKGGRPFTGHVVDGMGHPNGVAIYPPMVAQFSQDAMRVEETAWDVVIGATVDKDLIHPANDIIRHCWNMDEATGQCTNGHGISPTFRSVQDIVSKVDLNASIYHRCKDGSLIHWLREFYKAPHKAMVPDHTNDERETVVEPARDLAVGKPVDRTNESETKIQEVKEQVVADPVPSSGPVAKTEIFIVTYGLPTLRTSNKTVSDFDWLAWCLRGIRRHCSGFTGITLAIPSRDAEMLKPLATEHANSGSGIPLRIKMFNEKPGKGMLTHMVVMASAEEFVPKGTEFVMHLDSDCVFHTPSSPSDYITDGKPVYLIRSWAGLVDGRGVLSDCAQWKTPTEAQLGFESPWYSMCRLGQVFPISFYKAYRDHVQSVQKKPFMDYMLEGKNSFPQNRMDWTAMGCYAKHKREEDFQWIDIDKSPAPRDRFQVYWSHGGLNDSIISEIKKLIA